MNGPNPNKLVKTPIAQLGYGFVDKSFLPKDKDEYYLRNTQEKSDRKYRKLNAYEIEVLVRNNNTSDDWNNILVAKEFNPELVKNCKFNGLIKIGKLESICLTFSSLTLPVGIYNSNVISCTFGDNVVVDNVNYISHYIIDDEVILLNINEMITSSTAKFGNGIIKDGEQENKRVWLELCNENAGRKVIPFNGMQPADAWLWSKYRDDENLLQKLVEITEKEYNASRGYYGFVGTRTIIKNTASIKDVWIGEDAYIKGANKLKNLTINSNAVEGKTQIGEGCEIVNGIIGYGCRIFYGVKAVRFITANHSQLKYGARLINSYLGYNSTISCCEVLNALIFSSHEQHHNNSFLCAALVLGQSNLAAGATIGSNHNSRGADGEVIARRGFWPGLCVSIKHNSKFASFTILAKGDYSSELNIKMPFSLVSNDVTNDKLVIMPAYWFMYNMYALARNEWKYFDRDKRVERLQYFEYSSLAPDTIQEIFESINEIEKLIGEAWYKKENKTNATTTSIIKKGRELLVEKNSFCNIIEVDKHEIENSKRKVVFVKLATAYEIYNKVLRYYLSNLIVQFLSGSTNKEISLPKAIHHSWLNVGGQLLTAKNVDLLKQKIKNNSLKNWQSIHLFYSSCSNNYFIEKLQHALSVYYKIAGIKLLDKKMIKNLLLESIETKKWITNSIISSREKDYTNEFRKMVYNNEQEMNNVLGSFDSNSFIKEQKLETQSFIKSIKNILQKI